jgi:predicted transposase YbfD/YdcC
LCLYIDKNIYIKAGVINVAYRETSVSQCFKELTDPRVVGRSQYYLSDILTIVLCAVISNADGFNDIELFARCKEPFFRTFLELPNGIPSHDTFNRVMSMLSPDEFSKCFAEWVKSLSERIPGIIAIDGKTLRNSFHDAESRDCLHMVSAWSVENALVLGQVRTNEKSNEITAIPMLLSLLDIEDCIVTIDAMGCQTDIAQKILDGGGDYVLALKGNQGNSHEAVELLFKWEMKNNFSGVTHSTFSEEEKDHGRVETRNVFSIGRLEEIDGLGLEKWPCVKSVTLVKSMRKLNGKSTVEYRYYLSSLDADAERIGKAVRGHWGIENSLHWVLDVVFNEDKARNRKDHSAANMTMIRHMAVNIVKNDKSSKTSIRGRRLKAGWDDDYLLKLISKV